MVSQKPKYCKDFERNSHWRKLSMIMVWERYCNASPKPEFFLFSLFMFSFISQLIWVHLGWNFHRWFSMQKQVNWCTIDPFSLKFCTSQHSYPVQRSFFLTPWWSCGFSQNMEWSAYFISFHFTMVCHTPFKQRHPSSHCDWPPPYKGYEPPPLHPIRLAKLNPHCLPLSTLSSNIKEIQTADKSHFNTHLETSLMLIETFSCIWKQFSIMFLEP